MHNKRALPSPFAQKSVFAYQVGLSSSINIRETARDASDVTEVAEQREPRQHPKMKYEIGNIRNRPAAVSVPEIGALVAPPFLGNHHVIKSSMTSAPYLPCGMAERLHFRVIAAANVL